jgi:S-adenosylmethionine decarboxylase proenzyme
LFIRKVIDHLENKRKNEQDMMNGKRCEPAAATTTSRAETTTSDGSPPDLRQTPPASNNNNQVDNYKVLVTLRFILLTLSSATLLAFAVGRAARLMLLEGPRRALMLDPMDSPLWDRPDYHEGYYSRHAKILPPPILPSGKRLPKTVYTAKNFDTAMTARSASILLEHEEREEEGEQHVDEKECDEEGTCVDRKAERQEEAGGEHLPAGQHLLVDIEYVDSAFLNSEARLARAMVEVVNEASLTLLSYHCHALVPSGVSCVGVLLESHVSFHTWPEHGVITLDLFTCGSNPLVPVVPIIERLFGVPRNDGSSLTPHVVWSHKLRGFRPEVKNPLGTWDLGRDILGYMTMDYKKEVSF